MGRMRIPPRRIPQNVNPPGWRCIQLMIPDDDEWEHIAYSTLYDQLALVWFNWQRTGDDTGSKLCQIWRAALKTWTHCVPCPSVPSIGADSEDFMIRQNPDNPCQLQSSVDGLTWCTFADFSSCVATSLQQSLQPPPQPQPAPGECKGLDATIQANNALFLPFAIGGGDTITVTNLIGGWYDGGLDGWRCPNGSMYLFGECSSAAGSTHVGDPIPTIPHMSLIAKDSAGTYYDARTTFTITSGLPDQSSLTFQANDSDTSNDAGSASFHVEICKNTHPVTFYYGLCTNDWIVQQLPGQITWTPIALGVPTTITSEIPSDPGSGTPQCYAFVTFADSFDVHNGFVNSSNTFFKVTAVGASGASFTGGGNFWNYDYNATICGGSVSSSGQTATAPALTNKYKELLIRSISQFVMTITIEECS